MWFEFGLDGGFAFGFDFGFERGLDLKLILGLRLILGLILGLVLGLIVALIFGSFAPHPLPCLDPPHRQNPARDINKSRENPWGDPSILARQRRASNPPKGSCGTYLTGHPGAYLTSGA